MAETDIKIDDLPTGGSLQDSDSFVVEQGASGSRRTVRLNASAFKTYLPEPNQKDIWDTLGFVPAAQDGRNVSGTWDIAISGSAASLEYNKTYRITSLESATVNTKDLIVTGEVDLTGSTAIHFPNDTIAVKDTIRAENKVICEGQIETNTFKADGNADVGNLVSGSHVEGTKWRARPTNQPADNIYPQIYYDVDLNCWRGYVKTSTGGFWQDLSLRQIDDDPTNEVKDPYVGQQVVNKNARVWIYDGISWSIMWYPGK